MDIQKLQRAVIDALEDVKAQDIKVFNTTHLTSLFDRVVIASATSNRQTRALASSVREAVKTAGLPVLATEGEDNGEWIIVDCGAAVAHIMQPQMRDYYRLEELWGEKPVRMKLGGGAKKGLVKASADADRRAGAAKKAPAKKAVPKATTAKKTTAKASPAARKTATGGARKPPGAAKPRAAAKTAPRAGSPRAGAARKTARG